MMKVPKALSCNVYPRAGCQSICKVASVLFVIHDASDGSMQNRNCNGQTLSPVCLLSVYLT